MAGMIERARVAAKAVVGIFNEDSARAAYGLLSGIFPGAVGPPPVRGTREYLQAYSKMPWLRTVTARIAGKVAATDWQLYVAQKKPTPKTPPKAYRDVALQRAHPLSRRKAIKARLDTGDLRQIDDHPLLTLLADGNSFLTGEATRKVTQIHVDTVGEAFWLKERNALGVIIGIWPLPPDWVAATPTPLNPNFRVQFRAWRGFIPDTEILWFADPDPANPYGRGSGTAQALSDELETDEYAAKHSKAFFYNSARPDFIVYPKNATMREENAARLEDDWLNRHQGFWRAFKPYFMSREIGVHEFEQNFRAMQLVQLRQHERDTVMQCFGVPPEILGVLDNSNRATITAADLVFSRYVVEPRCEFLRCVLQERLVPEFDERLILDYASPVQDDKDFHLDVARAAPYAISVDEWRDMMGKPPLDDDAGLVHLIPNTSTPMDPTGEDGLIEPEPEPMPVPVGGPPPGAPAPAAPPPTGQRRYSWRRAV